jgi:hypothetical protein
VPTEHRSQHRERRQPAPNGRPRDAAHCALAGRSARLAARSAAARWPGVARCASAASKPNARQPPRIGRT